MLYLIAAAALGGLAHLAFRSIGHRQRWPPAFTILCAFGCVTGIVIGWTAHHGWVGSTPWLVAALYLGAAVSSWVGRRAA